ncbi:fluoride efflux transporter CrcB [Schinkia azotoformans]|uniref:fluoride efflux transporter CrcB n=1 Tax=Schinkia azotoformans TaxID=1454 RepID=UPI002DBDB931|nr:fluoride efflux transporter CrcB [Schinkia azotoformans]MEC1721615.1 fluoride efflux transporter CrcB [Schinkia azotoformans]MEC1742974.1 fluoride efflux transporter CrcB [Schinkia azotoformans]MEC1745350.1 fluoride efflux transporter CrcB [Schinkia azotoformans]MEC1757049.1 fluoride efflux transporter CrcB [Schinkia azotoformans]MEC1768212.1 fluoride efflux transporter CrcB [Schinkia azotoformans]
MIWIIGFGGAIGAAVRFLLGDFINKRWSKKLGRFPVGTWIINISGSFLLGVIANYHLSNSIEDWVWYFVGVGFCGAYTTFSTFGFETIRLIEDKKIKIAIEYILSSLVVGIASASVGFII